MTMSVLPLADLTVGFDPEFPGRVVALAVAAALHLPAMLVIPWLEALALSRGASAGAQLGNLASPGPALLGILLWGWKAVAGRRARGPGLPDLVLGAIGVMVALLLPLSLLPGPDGALMPLLVGVLAAGLCAWLLAVRMGSRLLRPVGPEDRPDPQDPKDPQNSPGEFGSGRRGGWTPAGPLVPIVGSGLLVLFAVHAPTAAGVLASLIAAGIVLRGRRGPAVFAAHFRFGASALAGGSASGVPDRSERIPGWVRDAAGAEPGSPPPTAVAGLLVGKSRGGPRSGWLVLLPGGPVFVHRSLTRTWETRLSHASERGRFHTPLALRLHLELDGEELVLLLAHRGSEPVAFDGGGGC
jgi:hypothetical protein